MPRPAMSDHCPCHRIGTRWGNERGRQVWQALSSVWTQSWTQGHRFEHNGIQDYGQGDCMTNKMRCAWSVVALGICAALQAQVISIYVDGDRRDGRFPPQLQNGRTLMFLRDTFDALNCAVQWYSADQRIKAWIAETEIELWIGKTEARVNGQTMMLDQAPIIDKATGSTLVPLRFIGEAVGAGIKYSARGNRVDIDRMQIPYWTETAPFKVGDTVEMLEQTRDRWIKAKVLRVFEVKVGLDRYNIEYTEDGPNGRVMRPTMSRSHIRKPRS